MSSSARPFEVADWGLVSSPGSRNLTTNVVWVKARVVQRAPPVRLTSLAACAPEFGVPAHPALDRFTAVDDPEEPTTIRPTPIPPDLLPWEAATAKDSRLPRRHIGKYELHGRLARGAFGVVYSAHDPSLDRNVALKVLRPTHLTNQEVVQRFLQEARATARVAHPGIVTIYDCGTVATRQGSTAFIAMELLSGESLTSRLVRVGRLDPPQACEIVRQIASALEAAHHADVLHRDLKPDNIYLVPDPAMPSGERIKVLDFGLAKLGAGGETRLQTVFGTPRYMSPEQTRSATQIDHRSDIYSLGCILFELVTGRPPFDGDVRQLLERHQRATPPRTASLATDVSTVLDDLIAEMLAKDPMHRPQTMGAVQRALRFAAGSSLALDASIAVRWSASAVLASPPPPGSPIAAQGTAVGPSPSSSLVGPPPSLDQPPVRPPVRSPVRPPTPSLDQPLVRPQTCSLVRPQASQPIQFPLSPPVPSALLDPPASPTAMLGPEVSPASLEVSLTSASLPPITDGDTEPVTCASDRMSGEIVVPASPPQVIAPQRAAARLPRAVFAWFGHRFGHRGRSPLRVGLCLLVIAVLIAVALAAAI
jgi:serine/threonine protein kinase